MNQIIEIIIALSVLFSFVYFAKLHHKYKNWKAKREVRKWENRITVKSICSRYGALNQQNIEDVEKELVQIKKLRSHKK